MAFYRTSIGGGGGGGSGWTFIEAVSQVPATATFTISTSLTVGKTYHIFTTNSGGSTSTADSVTAITASSGVSDLTRLHNVNGYYGSGTAYSSMFHYSFKATAQTVSFSKQAYARRLGYMLFAE